MQQIIDQVAQRAGIAPDKARTAVDTVVGYLKDHLPGPVASQLDNAVSDAGGGEQGGLGGMAQAAKGMLGGNKGNG